MSAEPSVTMAVIKMLAALALVLAALWALYIFMRRLNARHGTAGGQSLIRVLETRSLGMKKQVAVLEVMGDFFLVGISGDALTVLSRIRAGKAPFTGVEKALNADEPKGFGAYLGGLAGDAGQKDRG